MYTGVYTCRARVAELKMEPAFAHVVHWQYQLQCQCVNLITRDYCASSRFSKGYASVNFAGLRAPCAGLEATANKHTSSVCSCGMAMAMEPW